jgi:hypothetical protein
MKRLTTKEEAYAVARAAGMSQKEAYLHAGYTWKGRPDGEKLEASKLEMRPHVAARLQELRDAYATKVVEASRGAPPAEPARAYGVKEAMDELDEAAMLAKEKGNPQALAKVVEVRMKLYGLGVSDAKNPKDKEEVPPEELEAMLATLQAMKEKNAKPGTTH